MSISEMGRDGIIISFYRFPDDESHNSGSKIRKLKSLLICPSTPMSDNNFCQILHHFRACKLELAEGRTLKHLV